MELKKLKNKPKDTPVRKSRAKKGSSLKTKNHLGEVLEKKEEDVFVSITNNSEPLSIEKIKIEEEIFSTPVIDYVNEDIFSEQVLEKRKKIFLHYLPSVLILVFLLSSFYIFSKLPETKRNSSKISEIEANEIVKLVGKIIILPAGETPKIVTIKTEDLNTLKKQPFFSNAKIGDKVLVYSLSGKVILYNPGENKIVEVANVDIGNKPITTSL